MDCVKQIINANEVYKQGYYGDGVRIAILDTGVSRHRALEGKVTWFLDLVNGKQYSYDDNGHGTHIAGIICADGPRKKLSGMAPGADLIVFKVLDSRGNGRTEDVISALAWIKENHIRYRIKLINFSMGFLPTSAQSEQRIIMQCLEELWDLGVTVVTAAGNNGPRENSVTVPGVSKKVITVGSCDDNKIERYSKQGYSGRGPTECCIVKPEVLAPGTGILSLGKEEGYVRKSGSSMATPIVCGALALCYSKNMNLTPAELKLFLYKTCVRRSEKPYSNSWGILDVDHLISCI